MAIEGQYPKVDGDYLYGSEVTDFVNKSLFFGAQLSYNTGVIQDYNFTVIKYTSDLASSDSTMLYDSADDFYYPQMGANQAETSDTVHNPSSWTNPTFAFDLDDSTTFATKSGTPGVGEDFNWYLGKIFDEPRYIAYVKYHASWTASSGTSGFSLETYDLDTSTWSSEGSLGTGTVEGSTILDSSVGGIRIHASSVYGGTGSHTCEIYTINYGQVDTGTEYNIIVDDICAMRTVPSYMSVFTKTNDVNFTEYIDVRDTSSSSYGVTDKTTDELVVVTGLATTSLGAKFRYTQTDGNAPLLRVYGFGSAYQ